MRLKGLEKNSKVKLGLLEAKIGKESSISWCKAAVNSRKASQTVKTILNSTTNPEAAIFDLRRQKMESKLFHTKTKFLPKQMKKVKVFLMQRAVKKIKNAKETEEKVKLEEEVSRVKSLDHVKLANWTFSTQIFKNEEYLQGKLSEFVLSSHLNNEDKFEFDGIEKILSIKCYQDAVKATRSDLILFMKKLLHESVDEVIPVKQEEVKRTIAHKPTSSLRADRSFFMESLNADDNDNDNDNDDGSESEFNGNVAFSDDDEEEEAYGEYLNNDGEEADGSAKKKKNRLGQMARRRLAEKMFGQEAKHIKSGGLTVLQREELRKQKSQQRKERAARIKKDLVKATQILKQKEAQNSVAQPAIKIDPNMHPSWAAKLQQQAKIQQASFQGKKIKFEED